MPMAIFSGGGGTAPLSLPESEEQRRARELKAQIAAALGTKQAPVVQQPKRPSGAEAARSARSAGGAEGGNSSAGFGANTALQEVVNPGIITDFAESRDNKKQHESAFLGSLVKTVVSAATAGLVGDLVKGPNVAPTSPSSGPKKPSASVSAGMSRSALSGTAPASPTVVPQSALVQGLGPELAGMQASAGNPLNPAAIMERLSIQERMKLGMARMFTGPRYYGSRRRY